MDYKFISLGSVCEVAHCLKECSLRKEGYPFDYITTIDSDKFIQLLEDKFKNLLDDTYLIPCNNDPYPIYNNYYNIEFLHEGVFNKTEKSVYDLNYKNLQDKYKRRIERFLNLNDYTGKVYFIRHSYKYSISDPHRIYKNNDNIIITDDYAIKLYDVLKNIFTKLNFGLIIMNDHDENILIEEKKIHENLIMCKTNINLELDVKSKLYKNYLETL